MNPAEVPLDKALEMAFLPSALARSGRGVGRVVERSVLLLDSLHRSLFKIGKLVHVQSRTRLTTCCLRRIWERW